MQNDPAPRLLFCTMSTEVHHHEATLLSIVVGFMSENREGCKIQDSYNWIQRRERYAYISSYLHSSLSYCTLPYVSFTLNGTILSQLHTYFANLKAHFVLWFVNVQGKVVVYFNLLIYWKVLKTYTFLRLRRTYSRFVFSIVIVDTGKTMWIDGRISDSH